MSRKLFVLHEKNEKELEQFTRILAQIDSGLDPVPVSRAHVAKSRFDYSQHVGFLSLGGDGEDENANRIEKEYLRTAIERRRPVLAICQGAQMLAELRRAKSSRKTLFKLGQRHQGLSRLHLILDAEFDPVIRPIKQLTAFVANWHEYAFLCPDDATPLAVSVDCTHCEAFRVNEITYGLQFHPEVSEEELPSWQLAGVAEPEPGAYRRAAECGREILRAWFNLLT